MQTVRPLWYVLVAMLAMLLRSPSGAEIILGEPPPAPTDLSGLPGGGLSAQGVTGGFTVNPAAREQVRSFYNAVYRASEGVPMQTTANVATCTPGTNGTAFKEALLRRINWFRALAGLPASVTLNAANDAKCQEAAMLMSRNNTLSHFPSNNWPCFTANAANAASNANLAIGTMGPDSISAYIQDHGANNTAVGHRRWLLYPQTQIMGTGDVPQAGGFHEANAVWVFDANYGGPRPATREPFVAWPPSGHVPHPVVYPRWSFALANAIYTNATVTMRSNGVNVAVALEPLQGNIGENTLVWVPMGLNAASSDTQFPFNGVDTVYSITVTNIRVGLSTTGFSYAVTVFDPDVPGADFQPPTISGPLQPVVGQENAYTFTAISNASGYEWRAGLRSPYEFRDGAEAGLGNFIVETSAGYSVLITSPVAAGNFAFNLQHRTPPVSQLLTLPETFYPRTNTVLSFRSRLAWAWFDEYAKVQVSTNHGASWFDVYSQAGDGGMGESSFTLKTIPLGGLVGRPARLRFNYLFAGGNYYQGEIPGDGWVIDAIELTNAELWTEVNTTATTTTNFTFNPALPASYDLEVRALIFDEFPLDWGPALIVTATTNAPPVIVMNPPEIVGGAVQLNFALTSGAAMNFRLLQADQVNGTWTTNGSAALTTNVPDSSYRFTTSVGPAARFYRVLAW
ncbi:MAG: CAP domain-containing protein [Verrucomicrobiae bacterium]|nr:CAP domain-containing protein [Verrucomicrobiae bacterium]